jgi:hypothetical protein
MLFKTSEDALKVDQDPNGSRVGTQNIHGLGFTENPWGEKAHTFVKTTM